MVELSIVLVILGLLVGGILAGRALIESATYRATLADIDKVKTASLAFRDKYMNLPGDMPNATAFFTASTQPDKVTNGDGSGAISIMTGAYTAGDPAIGWGYSNLPSFYVEYTGVFDHLSAAGLYAIPQYDEETRFNGPEVRFRSRGGVSDIYGNATTRTCMSIGFIKGYSYLSSGHKITLGALGCNWGLLGAGWTAGVNPWEAWLLDRKIDDGLPFSGAMIAMSPNYFYSNNVATYCAVSSTNEYRQENNILLGAGGVERLRACALYINAGF